ncbi:unnamed protein product [Kuraishia capsulata CBS 1993]|uniref:Uncharacterized protein n=1 Tax=Kuraishia capsulata CBS 1993 TaxID=1382522 RepID=W6MX56_9ASCO|nr:uncharacterized protein KUCA_T00004287001 [Kuraishia capsulata CBS 1993]CDK28305.1 unnamed protein product [Kuraishia capsulata CBS 1993]
MAPLIRTKDHQFRSFETRVSTLTRAVNLVLYCSYGICILLPLPNPIAKISVAVFTGLYTFVMLLFAVYVQLSQSHIDSLPQKEDLGQQPVRAIFRRLLNMPSVIIDRIMGLLIHLLGIAYRFVSGKQASTHSEAPLISSRVLSFLILTLRKEVAFLCWVYITTEDSTAVHYKSFVAMCSMTTIHQWFIISQKQGVETTKSSASLLWKSKSKNSKRVRWYNSGRVYFVGCVILAISVPVTMYKHQIEHHHHNESWLTVIDTQQLCYWFLDLQFTTTVFQDIMDLELRVVNGAHGGGVLRSDDERVHLV